MSNKIKIVIVDNADEIIDYFSSLLTKTGDFEVVGSANSGLTSIPIILQAKPDIVLMDIQMETMTAGIDAVEAIGAIDKSIKFVMLTIHLEDDLLFKAYTAGAIDYLIKTDSPDKIIEALKNVHENTYSLRPEISKRIMAEFVRLQKMQSSLIDTLNIVSKLTNSEFEILTLVSEGYTYKQIANMRFVTEGTVKLQANRLIKKFELKSMKDIIKLIKQTKILDLYDKKVDY